MTLAFRDSLGLASPDECSVVGFIEASPVFTVGEIEIIVSSGIDESAETVILKSDRLTLKA